jgi:phenylacetate 2-hydroxylase
MCVGSHLANRELYVAFARVVMTMRLTEARDARDRPILNALECTSNKTGLTLDPKPFRIRLIMREGADRWIQSS